MNFIHPGVLPVVLPVVLPAPKRGRAGNPIYEQTMNGFTPKFRFFAMLPPVFAVLPSGNTGNVGPMRVCGPVLPMLPMLPPL